MKLSHDLKKKRVLSVWNSGILCALAVSITIIAVSIVRRTDACGERLYRVLDRASALAPTLTPWQGVGGCGAGGSGSNTDGIKWVGQGVSGGLIQVEILPKYNFGKNFHNLNIAPRFTVKPWWHTTIGLNLPFSSKNAEVQHQANKEPKTMVSGGMGDLSCDIMRTLGSQGQFTLGVLLAFPTGQYDIKRGTESSKEFLPINLQMGGGVFNAGIQFSYTRDVENGLWLFDATYNFPYMLRLFTQENEFLDTYYKAYKDQTDNSRFYYTAKPYGENDLGDYVPPSFTVSGIYAYRGVPGFVHSFGLTFAIPLGVAWIHSENTSVYDPQPDPDHKSWQAVLTYGLEFSRDKFPVFVAVALPLHEKSPGDTGYDPEPMKKWSGPDWEDFLQQWVLAVGIKSALF